MEIENPNLSYLDGGGCLGINPVDDLHPNPDGGYYKVVLGIYNRRNFEGQYFRALDLAKIQETRKVFYVELNSPTFYQLLNDPSKAPGPVLDAYTERVMTIHQDRVVGYVQDLAEFILPNGHQLVHGKFYPKGPFATVAQELLANPEEWLSFGHRALGHIAEFEPGLPNEFKVIHFVTWDLVGGKPALPTTAAAPGEEVKITEVVKTPIPSLTKEYVEKEVTQVYTEEEFAKLEPLTPKAGDYEEIILQFRERAADTGLSIMIEQLWRTVSWAVMKRLGKENVEGELVGGSMISTRSDVKHPIFTFLLKDKRTGDFQLGMLFKMSVDRKKVTMAEVLDQEALAKRMVPTGPAQ